MKPLVNGHPAPGECWEEYAEHSLTHDDLPPVTMADLTPGTRVRHIHWRVPAAGSARPGASRRSPGTGRSSRTR